MRELLIATSNKGKIREIKEILAGIPYDIKTLADIDIKEDIPETGKSFEENAILKAKYAGGKSGLLTLAEDSGLEVDALAGKPGIYSARYVEGTDEDRINKILGELKEFPKEKRTARFKAVVAVYDPLGNKAQIFRGVSEGYITDIPSGDYGFGYDPIFYNQDLNKTNAEMTLEEKNKVSHRFRAISQAKEFLLKSIHRTNGY